MRRSSSFFARFRAFDLVVPLRSFVCSLSRPRPGLFFLRKTRNEEETEKNKKRTKINENNNNNNNNSGNKSNSLSVFPSLSASGARTRNPFYCFIFSLFRFFCIAPFILQPRCKSTQDSLGGSLPIEASRRLCYVYLMRCQTRLLSKSDDRGRPSSFC